MNMASRLYTVMWDETLVGMFAVLSMPNRALKNAFRGSRLVILPEYQSLGIGSKLYQEIGEMYIERGEKLFLACTHIRLATMIDENKVWRKTHDYGKLSHPRPNDYGALQKTSRFGKIMYSGEYMGSDYADKPHRYIAIDFNDDFKGKEQMFEDLLELKKSYYLDIITGQQKVDSELETFCKKNGIRNDLLYAKTKGETTMIKKYQKRVVTEWNYNVMLEIILGGEKFETSIF